MNALNEGDRFAVSPAEYTCLFAKVISEGPEGLRLVAFSDGTQSVDFTEQHENWLRLGPDEDILYLAGPMRGIQYYNSDTFSVAASLLLEAGFEHVINPIEMDYEFGFDYEDLPKFHDWNEVPLGFSIEQAAARCLSGVMVSDRIVMLPGWRDSRGAMAEYHLAKWIGKQVAEAEFYENDEGLLKIRLRAEGVVQKSKTLSETLQSYSRKFLNNFFNSER
jgi:hypothetical protein